MKEGEYPRARLDCLTREFGDEVLVYDRERNVGHCLNATAAATWKLCDGKKSTSELAKILTRQLSAPVDESVVQLAVESCPGRVCLSNRKSRSGEPRGATQSARLASPEPSLCRW